MEDTQCDREFNSVSTRDTFLALQWIIVLRNINFRQDSAHVHLRTGWIFPFSTDLEMDSMEETLCDRELNSASTGDILLRCNGFLCWKILIFDKILITSTLELAGFVIFSLHSEIDSFFGGYAVW